MLRSYFWLLGAYETFTAVTIELTACVFFVTASFVLYHANTTFQPRLFVPFLLYSVSWLV